MCACPDANISIHALREEGDTCSNKELCDYLISIHALREEGDMPVTYSPYFSSNFNPRPPRRGRRTNGTGKLTTLHFNPRPPRRGRLRWNWRCWWTKQFQSTPSAKRATDSASDTSRSQRFQSTPSAKRATGNYRIFQHDTKFQSTPSAKRATESRLARAVKYPISIHALREEGDLCDVGVFCSILLISIHALREEGDAHTARRGSHEGHFNPRPPRRGRLLPRKLKRAHRHFNPRPPRRGRR